MRSQVLDRGRVAALSARGVCLVLPVPGRVAAEERPRYGDVAVESSPCPADAVVDSLGAALDALVGADLDAVGDAALGERIAVMHTAVQRLEGERLRLLREFDVRKAWMGAGASSAKGWLSDTCGIGIGEAAGDVETARQLGRLPATAAALAGGDLSLRKAKVITRAAKQLAGAGDGALDDLASAARTADLSSLREAVDKVVDDVDAEARRREEYDAHARRRVTKRLLPDGSVAGEYRLDPVDGEAFLTALDAKTRPDGPDDDRTPEQRAADALAELAWQALNRGDLPDVGGERPHVSVLLPPGGEGPAQLDHVGAISDDAAAMLSCDASIRRVVMRGRSEVLDVGRATRTPTAAQRRAVIARDRRCVGCGAPAGWCEVHHVRHWRDGGTTDLDNLALVCRRCHRKIHLERWVIRLDPTGGWELVAPPQRPGRHRQRRRPPAATDTPATGATRRTADPVAG